MGGSEVDSSINFQDLMLPYAEGQTCIDNVLWRFFMVIHFHNGCTLEPTSIGESLVMYLCTE